MNHGGDDLDDDFVPDDIVAMSEEEDLPETEDIGELLSADEDGGKDGQSSQTQNAAAAEKKRKRRAKEKERKAKVCSYQPRRMLIFSYVHS